MSDEILSAFYWRENMRNAPTVRGGQYGYRRTSDEVNILRKRIAELRDEGKTQKQVGEELGISHRYVGELYRLKWRVRKEKK
jgi:hypothetical protein